MRTPALVALVSMLLLLALPTPGHSQGLPTACYNLIEDSVFTRSLTAGIVGSGITYESLIAQSLLTGDEPWYTGSPPRGGVAVIDSLHRVNAVLTEGVLATILTDQNRYGSGAAMEAAYQFKRLEGRASVLLPHLVTALGANRVLIGLSALRPGLSDAESRVVTFLACQAGWALEAFAADPRFARGWSRGDTYNDWPSQNDYILAEAARLLAGEWRATVLDLIRVSGAVEREPDLERMIR